MLDKTLGYILCCQSPGLFLAAAVLVIAYFAGRRKHRFKAVLKLLLGIVCAVGGIALYYLGMYDEYFTIRDFYQIRPAGWVGVGIAAFFTLLALVRAFFAAADARREEKAANRAENQRLGGGGRGCRGRRPGEGPPGDGGACTAGDPRRGRTCGRGACVRAGASGGGTGAGDAGGTCTDGSVT